MLSVITDTISDIIKVIPFLFLTYILMEWIEHRTVDKSQNLIAKAGKAGPVIGALLGAFPQCGFSASGATLFAGHVISTGTLTAIFLSTSDEMLPIMIAENAPAGFIIKVIMMKAAIGIVCGLLVDLLIYPAKKTGKPVDIDNLCKNASCGCKDEHHIFKPALMHTVRMGAFLLCITFLINLLFYFAGEDVLTNVFTGIPLVENILCALIGLIPNCAASIAITKLYLEGLISFSAMMSGLLSGAGIGILVLCRVNRDRSENIRIIAMLFGFAVVFGFISGIINGIF